MLSKMQMDSGSVRVCLAVLSSLFATVFAEEDVNNDVVDNFILANVPMTLPRISFSVLFAVLAAGGHYGSIRYLMPSNIKMNYYLQSTSILFSFVFFVAALAEATVNQVITVPFYMINLVFPSALITLITAALIKLGWVNRTNSYFVDQSGGGNNAPTGAEISALTTSAEGDDTVNAYSVVLEKDPTYKLNIDTACTMLGRVSGGAGQAAEIADAGKKKNIVDLIERLVVRGKELHGRVATLNKAEKAEFENIKAALSKSKKHYRVGPETTPIHEFKDAAKDYVKELTAAVKEKTTDVNIDKHLSLFFEAWTKKTPETEVAIKEQLVLLHTNIIALFKADKYPVTNAQVAETSLKSLRKVIKAFAPHAKLTAPTKGDIIPNGSNDFIFSTVSNSLKVMLKACVSFVLKDKLSKDPVKSYKIFNERTEGPYTAATISSQFIPELKKFIDLFEDDNLTYEDIETTFKPVEPMIKSHFKALGKLVEEITKAGNSRKQDCNLIYKAFEGIDLSKLGKTIKDGISELLLAMLEACDPDAARIQICKKLEEELDLCIKEPNNAKKLVEVLIDVAPKYKELLSPNTAKVTKPVLDRLIVVKQAIDKLIDAALILPFTEENKVRVGTLDFLLASKKSRFPKEKLLSGDATTRLFASKIQSLSKYHDRFTVELELVSNTKNVTDTTKAFKEAKADFKKLSDAIIAAKGTLAIHEAADNKTQVDLLKKALKDAATIVLDEIKKWVALTGKNAVNTSDELTKLLAVIEGAKPISAFTKKDLGIDATDDVYFKSEYDKLVPFERKTKDALFIAKAASLKIATLEDAKLLNFDALILRTIVILSSNSYPGSLSDLANEHGDPFEKACSELFQTINLCTQAFTAKVQDLDSLDAPTKKQKCLEILNLLKASKIVGEDNAFTPIFAKRYDGSNNVFFGDAVTTIIEEATQ